MSQTIKELLEALWQDKKCRCPLHIVRWSREPVGYEEHPFIYWQKGRIVNGKRR